jgi:hypothetical protein
MVFDFENFSSKLDLGNAAHLFLSSTMSAATPQMSIDMDLTIMLSFL